MQEAQAEANATGRCVVGELADTILTRVRGASVGIITIHTRRATDVPRRAAVAVAAPVRKALILAAATLPVVSFPEAASTLAVVVALAVGIGRADCETLGGGLTLKVSRTRPGRAALRTVAASIAKLSLGEDARVTEGWDAGGALDGGGTRASGPRTAVDPTGVASAAIRLIAAEGTIAVLAEGGCGVEQVRAVGRLAEVAVVEAVALEIGAGFGGTWVPIFTLRRDSTARPARAADAVRAVFREALVCRTAGGAARLFREALACRAIVARHALGVGRATGIATALIRAA